MAFRGPSEHPQLFKALDGCLASAQRLGHRDPFRSVTVTVAQTLLGLRLGRNSNTGTKLPLQ